MHVELKEDGLDIGCHRVARLMRDNGLKALQQAIVIRVPAPGLIHHSDRGSQYCSYEYRDLLEDHHIRAFMSGNGNCHDNAMVETAFKSIKSELVWRTGFQTRQ